MGISFFLWLVPNLAALLLLLGVGHYSWAWKYRRILAEVVVALNLASVTFLFATEFAFGLQIALLLAEVWMVLLAVRLLFGRLPEEFLRSSTQLNSVIGLVIYLVVVDLWLILRGVAPDALPYDKLLIMLPLISTVIGLGFLYQIAWTLKHYRLRGLNQNLRLKDMPTVTLAIPARNENHALEACLRAAIASEYPKLEIIVMDDDSGDKTPDIIRSFAREGVRFVQGKKPAEGWLGKNQAMNTLAEQSSGDFIILTDVDTHLSPDSVSKLINYALTNKQEMVTVLPTRRDGWSAATLLTTLRYYWQIALPITARRVPVASQCWLIRRSTLLKIGGFEGVAHKIVPEGYFARVLFVHDQYRFVISNEQLGITTAKKWSSQAETAIRYLYPTLRRQPMSVLAAIIMVGLFFVVPFVMLVALPHDMRLLLPAIAAAVVLWLGYALVVARTHVYTWPATLVLFPLSLVQDIVLMIVSMLRYEFGEVNWKGRDVSGSELSDKSHTSFNG